MFRGLGMRLLGAGSARRSPGSSWTLRHAPRPRSDTSAATPERSTWSLRWASVAAAGPPTRPSPAQGSGLGDRPILLSVSAKRPHKNLRR